MDELFARIHDGLPREAPGSEETTRILFDLVLDRLPDRPRVADMGCGTGPAALVLAEAGAQVVAVDTHRPFLDDLTARAAARGVGERIEIRCAPMEDPGLAPGSVDLIWAEGSAYAVGVDAALAAWAPLLAPGGMIVFTELEWTSQSPSAEAREFWAAYPGMRDEAGNHRAFEAAGWTVVASRLLPDSDWDAYYGPMSARIAELEADGADPPAIAGHRAEIDLRARHGDEYGYRAYVLA